MLVLNSNYLAVTFQNYKAYITFPSHFGYPSNVNTTMLPHYNLFSIVRDIRTWHAYIVAFSCWLPIQCEHNYANKFLVCFQVSITHSCIHTNTVNKNHVHVHIIILSLLLLLIIIILLYHFSGYLCFLCFWFNRLAWGLV